MSNILVLDSTVRAAYAAWLATNAKARNAISARAFILTYPGSRTLSTDDLYALACDLAGISPVWCLNAPLDPSVLTDEERKVIAGLRARGFAVALFNPKELDGIAAQEAESAMVEAVNNATW